MEQRLLPYGKEIPPRKLLNMIGHHCVRDPNAQDRLIQLEWDNIKMDGTTLQNAAEFLSKVKDVLSRTRIGLINYTTVFDKVTIALAKVHDPGLKEDVRNLVNLHPEDEERRWNICLA